MRAVLCTAFEGIKALIVGEHPNHAREPDEVLIDVYAASVSYMDYLMISGGYQMRPALPYVPGTELPGWSWPRQQVDRFGPGDRVACEGWFGGFAEQMTAKAIRNRVAFPTIRISGGIDPVAYLSDGSVCAGRRARLKVRRNRLRDGRVRRRRSCLCRAGPSAGARVIARRRQRRQSIDRARLWR